MALGRVLIADDSKTMVTFVESALERMVHLVTDVVNDGSKALNAVLNTRYSLVILDHDMPGMTGLDVRQHTKHRILADVHFTKATAPLSVRADRVLATFLKLLSLMRRPLSRCPPTSWSACRATSSITARWLQGDSVRKFWRRCSSVSGTTSAIRSMFRLRSGASIKPRRHSPA